MDTTDPNTWRWIWLMAAVFFGIGEMAVAGSFFLAPFAVGAATAALLAFLGVPVPLEWVAFVGVSAACFLPLRELSKRLDLSGPSLGVGSYRQIGQRARVVEKIDHSVDSGFVMLGPDRWRAESSDGSPIEAGATVTVTEVRGTRLIVTIGTPEPEDLPNPSSFDPRPPVADPT